MEASVLSGEWDEQQKIGSCMEEPTQGSNVWKYCRENVCRTGLLGCD